MHIRRRKDWELPESAATPEAIFLNRRALMVAGAGAILGAAGFGRMGGALAADDALTSLLPAKRNEAYQLGAGRTLTPAKTNESYNNFYEFGTSKYVASAAQALKTRPWTVKIDGLVEKPFEMDFDDLIKKVALEERLYRHRCVEAWSMTIPWTGFTLASLVALAKPMADAKYVQFETGISDGPGWAGSIRGPIPRA